MNNLSRKNRQTQDTTGIVRLSSTGDISSAIPAITDNMTAVIGDMKNINTNIDAVIPKTVPSSDFLPYILCFPKFRPATVDTLSRTERTIIDVIVISSPKKRRQNKTPTKRKEPLFPEMSRLFQVS